MKALAKKLVNVQTGIRTVNKDGHNDFHNYDYATEAGFLAVLRPLLIQQGLVILSSVKDSAIIQQVKNNAGKESPLTRVQMEFTIVDSESGETFVGGAEGYGSDGMDKGIYKAITGATKYFLAKCFLIPTGDDPENDTTKPQEGETIYEPNYGSEYGSDNFPDGPPQSVKAKADLGNCSKCGASNKLSKAGKPYCSKLCWKAED